MGERVILAIYSAGQLHNPVLGVILEYFGVICSGKERQFILSKTFSTFYCGEGFPHTSKGGHQILHCGFCP